MTKSKLGTQVKRQWQQSKHHRLNRLRWNPIAISGATKRVYIDFLLFPSKYLQRFLFSPTNRFWARIMWWSAHWLVSCSSPALIKKLFTNFCCFKSGAISVNYRRKSFLSLFHLFFVCRKTRKLFCVLRAVKTPESTFQKTRQCFVSLSYKHNKLPPRHICQQTTQTTASLSHLIRRAGSGAGGWALLLRLLLHGLLTRWARLLFNLLLLWSPLWSKIRWYQKAISFDEIEARNWRVRHRKLWPCWDFWS